MPVTPDSATEQVPQRGAILPMLPSSLWSCSEATSPDRFGSCDADFDRGPGIYPLRVMVEHNEANWVTNTPNTYRPTGS